MIRGHLEYRNEELGIRVSVKWMRLKEGAKMEYLMSGKKMDCILRYHKDRGNWYLAGLDGEVLRQGKQLHNALVMIGEGDYYNALK